MQANNFTTQDAVQKFLFRNHAMRGQLLDLTQVWQELQKDRGYPQPLRDMFGQLVSLATLLASGLKNPGRIILQVQGEGAVNLLLVDITDQLQIKGMAKTQETIEGNPTADEMLGNGQIVITLENSLTESFYQSIVDRKGATFLESIENFLTQSEQLDSRVWISVSQEKIRALYIQKMPETDALDSDAWNRINHLASTIKDEEMQKLENAELLTTLFYEEEIELYQPQEVEYNCKQDREKIAAMIQSLGEQEAREIIAQEGAIVVYNDLCNYHEKFTEEDVDLLFAK